MPRRPDNVWRGNTLPQAPTHQNPFETLLRACCSLPSDHAHDSGLVKYRQNRGLLRQKPRLPQKSSTSRDYGASAPG